MQKNNIVILGGGTAGWLTALFANNVFPEKNITLIQSKEVGTIGVGEATTPHLPGFLRRLNINPMDVIKHTNGSIKNGISFDNWNGDNKKYFHSFGEHVSKFTIPNIFDNQCQTYYKQVLISKNLPMDEYQYHSRISYKNRIDLENTSWALHFDAKLLAEYLEKVGAQRGINIVDGKFRDVSTDEQGFITAINLENDITVPCDFVFDCSGFNRVLIEKHFKQKWISYSDHLPMKCAIPFWLDSEEEIQPYTTATAMKYGWMWKIPLQHRIGSGYVFDSDYINEDQALKEAEEFYGRSLKVNKVIKFDAGRIENFWVKNCIAVGLSSNFIEPLESTSLFITCNQLDFIKHYINEFDNPRESSVKTFNKVMEETQRSILNFVYFHYITKRQDSVFWKEFRQKNSVPTGFEETLLALREANIRPQNLNEGSSIASFGMLSYLQVGAGLEIFEQPMCMSGYENINPSPDQYRAMLNNRLVNFSQNHKEFLMSLKNDN
jgi:tryptophan halogenase